MKKNLKNYLVLLLLIVSCSDSDEVQDVTEGLIVHYKFDGDTKDASVNSFHTISNASLTNDRFNKVNSAYNFNGIDEYIDLPNIPQLKPQLPMTISFWVYFDDLEVTKTFMFTTDFATDINSGINMSLTSPKSSFAVAYGDGGSPSIYSRRTKVGSTIVKEKTWYFVVVTVVDALDMDIYISEYNSGNLCVNDGGDYSGQGSAMQYTDKSGSIGRKDANTEKDPYYFKGKIDEFRIWNRVLTIEEINRIYKIQVDM